jgi:hypothetical protein
VAGRGEAGVRVRVREPVGAAVHARGYSRCILESPHGPMIGSGAGDCAPAPSHTTGRAGFRIRRLNAAALYTEAARSDGITNP